MSEPTIAILDYGIGNLHSAHKGFAQAGANAVLVDFHPRPEEALCDGPQALLLEELPRLIEDVRIVREAYQTRIERVALPAAAR